MTKESDNHNHDTGNNYDGRRTIGLLEFVTAAITLIAAIIGLVIVIESRQRNTEEEQSSVDDSVSVSKATVAEDPTEATTAESTKTSEQTQSPEELAKRGVEINAEWEPYSQEFDGFEMVLVPAGCFIMGSPVGGEEDERPALQRCFTSPFWIDRFEVTNAQYGSTGEFSGNNHPRDSVNWSQAVNFCRSRGARLPYEEEWEYAARGPDALEYPWGVGFIEENVVTVNHELGRKVSRNR